MQQLELSAKVHNLQIRTDCVVNGVCIEFDQNDEVVAANYPSGNRFRCNISYIIQQSVEGNGFLDLNMMLHPLD